MFVLDNIFYLNLLQNDYEDCEGEMSRESSQEYPAISGNYFIYYLHLHIKVRVHQFYVYLVINS